MRELSFRDVLDDGLRKQEYRKNLKPYIKRMIGMIEEEPFFTDFYSRGWIIERMMNQVNIEKRRIRNFYNAQHDEINQAITLTTDKKELANIRKVKREFTLQRAEVIPGYDWKSLRLFENILNEIKKEKYGSNI